MVKRVILIIKKIIHKLLKIGRRENYFQDCRITNIFDYNEVIRKRPGTDKNVLLTNRYYGMNYVLKRYSGYKGIINSAMEHGPNLDCEDGEYSDKSTPALIVQSTQRKNFVRNKKIGKPVFSVGTSIYYGESIFNEYDLQVVKDNLGKTLLIYPVHDIEDFHYIQSTEKFIDFVKSIKEEHQYKTVLVSMYFVDIERGRHLRYIQEGWTIVSAGRRENYDFCDNMKTIISMADFAIFQAYTSAIGFCTYMKVPSMIYHQQVLFTEKGKEGFQTDMGVKDTTMAKFEQVFCKYDETISQEKYDFCNYWFGFEDIWERENLKLLFEYLKKLKSNYSTEKMHKLANKKKYMPIKSILDEAIDNIG